MNDASYPTEAEWQARERQVADEVSHRLREVCAHLPPDSFTLLVDRIALVTVKYERRFLVASRGPATLFRE